MVFVCVWMNDKESLDHHHYVQYSWKSWGLVINGAPPWWPFFAPPWLPFCDSGALKLVWRRRSDPNPRRLFDSSVFLEKTSLKLCVYVFLVICVSLRDRHFCAHLQVSFSQQLSTPRQIRSNRMSMWVVGVGISRVFNRMMRLIYNSRTSGYGLFGKTLQIKSNAALNGFSIKSVSFYPTNQSINQLKSKHRHPVER